MRKLLAIAISVACVTAWSQAISTSQVSGTVQDATGAAIPAAQVVLRQTETGQSRATVTGTDGSFILPNLPIGPYRMEVAKEGFATYVQTGIVLNVNTNPIINATLKIGAVSEQVIGPGRGPGGGNPLAAASVRSSATRKWSNCRSMRASRPS